MAMPRTLVVTVPGMISDEGLSGLRQRSEVDYVERDSVSEQELADLCAGHDYLMLNYDVIKQLTPAFYEHENVRALEAISTDITGMDWAATAGAARHGVRLLNIPHYSTESVAESILCEILLHSRQRHSAYVDEIRGRDVEAREGFNVRNRRAGVIGLGSIGSRLAELLDAVGMDIVGWNRSPREDRRLLSLEEVFETSKVICICLKTVRSGPDANLGIIGRDLLMRCNQAVIVNLANVDLVDHEAMAEAIAAGKVIGYSVERKKELLDSPLGSADAVHMPPSNAWSSPESLKALQETWVANITEAMDGRYPNQYVE